MFGFGRRPASLPSSFGFGVATADHQCEAFRPSCPDIWDIWEQENDLVSRGRATDLWYRYREDVRLARELGCRFFRFSIAWSRVEPEPGFFDDDAFAHYRRMVDDIAAAGMEPMVTLLHFTWPPHVERADGLLAEDFPDRFACYAREVACRLGPSVCYWITVNEPGGLVPGYLRFWWMPPTGTRPPGILPGLDDTNQIDRVRRLIRNLFLAHQAARRAIKEVDPRAKVGVNPEHHGIPRFLAQLLFHPTALLARLRGRSPARRLDDFTRQTRSMIQRTHRDAGDADLVVGTLSATDDRATQVALSDVYFVAHQRLLVRRDDRSIVDAADLAGRTFAAVRGTTADPDAEKRVPGAHVQLNNTYQDALKALDRREVDAVLGDDAILVGLCNGSAGSYRLLPDRLATEYYTVGVPHGNNDLRDAVNRATWRFKRDGRWMRSYERYVAPLFADVPNAPPPDHPPARPLIDVLGADPALPPVGQGTPGLQPILDRGYLVAATRGDVPGFSLRNPKTGRYHGFEIELVEAVAREIFGEDSDPDKRIQYRRVGRANRTAIVRSWLFSLLPPWLADSPLGGLVRTLVQTMGFPLTRLYQTASFAVTWFASDWWYQGMCGELPEELCPEGCRGQLDFVGVDYYWGAAPWDFESIGDFKNAITGRYSDAPVWPSVLTNHLLELARWFPNLPIIICENGCVDVADGVARGEYLRRHVRAVQQAVERGANVIGYVCWSITSNREWALAFGPDNDFGLYHIDLDERGLARRPTPAVEVYRQIINNLGADP